MINFGSFSDNHPSQSTIDSSTICTSVSRRSNIKLDFDEETPRNSALQVGPSRHMANIFLRKERKNLSDSTPSRSQMKNINPHNSSNFQDLFLKSQNDCTGDSDGLKATGTFLPRLGSSESLETDKISIQDQLSEAQPQTLTEIHEDQLLAEIPLAASIQRHTHRSFTECFARTKLPAANTKSKQKSVAEVSDHEESLKNKLSLSVSKNLRDPDLTTISAQTVADLIRDSPSSHYLIVDCRFSYEYQGGKIKGAINVTSLEMLEKIFFTYKSLLYNPQYIEDLKKDTTGTLENVDSYTNDENSGLLNTRLPLVIFHCEFSQKRGPRAFRALRNTDRQKNLKTWPRLDFPEIYILEGGYSVFFSEFAEFCEGTYVKMVEKTHRIEYALAKDNDKKLWGKKYVVEYN